MPTKAVPAQWLLDMGAVPDGDPVNSEFAFVVRRADDKANGLKVVVEARSGLCALEEMAPTGRTVAVIPLADRPISPGELVDLVTDLRVVNRGPREKKGIPSK